MKNSVRYSVFSLLLLSAILLSVLVPGGPIETRNFSHISPLVLGGFNIFLTTLSLASFWLLYFIWQQQRWAFIASAMSGVAYFAVYVLDLAHWFPVSPDAMSPVLFVIEVLGTIVSIPLTVLSINGVDADSELFNGQQQSLYSGNTLIVDVAKTVSNKQVALFVLVSAGLLGIGIVIFATRSAMGL